MRNIPNTSNISFNKQKNKYEVVVFIGKKAKRLATGRTLIEALMMRDWCRENNWNKFVYRSQHIQETRCGRFQIYKDIKKDGSSKRETFGTFSSFEEAQKERDLLMKYDWDLETLCLLE